MKLDMKRDMTSGIKPTTTRAMHIAPARSQRGAAALVVTLTLFLAMALGALAIKRGLASEQRHAANQVRAAQAFEAAEAGLAWAQAQLNSTAAVGADCRPSSDPSAASFRDRVLTLDAASGAILVKPLHPACVRGASGWSCMCANSGSLLPPSAIGIDADTPAFSLDFTPGAQAGLVHIDAHGCTALASACAPSSATSVDAAAATSGSADASVTTSATLALFGGLRLPGTAPATALIVRDTLHQTAEQFFAGWFGLDQPTWREQSIVARVACSGDCGAAIAGALAAGATLVFVDGDAQLGGPLAMGSAVHPVVVVAHGTLRLDGPVSFVGALYAGAIVVGTPGASVQGSVFTEGGYAGPSAPSFHLDTGVLTVLAHQTGSFVRVAGSWRDF